jgi:DNA-binding transcriptional ArsR family regulator
MRQQLNLDSAAKPTFLRVIVAKTWDDLVRCKAARMSLPQFEVQGALFESLGAVAPDLFSDNDKIQVFAGKIWPVLARCRQELTQCYQSNNGRPGVEPMLLLGVLIFQGLQRAKWGREKKDLRSQVAAYILQSSNCTMESRRDVFQAIADPTRRAILTLLAVQALTPGAIADNFKSARQTISKHIQILTECELLKPEQNGREIYYHINAKTMTEVADFIEPFRKMWDDRFNRLEALMKKYKSNK